LSTSALTGGASTPSGTFAWTAPTTVPLVYNNGYSVTFTPTDTNYNTATNTVSISVFFTSVADFGTWLESQSTNNAATAYTVKLNVSDLGGSVSTDGSIGAVLNAKPSKYVYLDLSDSTITTIPDSAFGSYDIEGCATLTGITMPNTVTSIGLNAFRGTSLTSITIPDSVTTIGDQAFLGTGLTSVTIPNSVTSIGTMAFFGTSLTSVTFERAGTTIADEYTFPGGSSLQSAYTAGGIGTYKRPNTTSDTWSKQ